ncbi:D-alanyl-D-alanine carboxypeptidase family protein [Lysobacter korlensis]|uniref:D-alanyl-D-alanine carboxypeptidase family protein n=1 Tax=Lysobacter korlensis TaxID=553636 RepID=A0ABV6RLJ0_9GAMM
MRSNTFQLVNTPEIELWPARLLSARSNHHARLLARSDTVLRRKRDGRYLATLAGGELVGLVPQWKRDAGVEAALAAVAALHRPRRDAATGIRALATLPLDRLSAHLGRLGIGDEYGARTGLAIVAEPERLAFAGFDRYRRPLWMRADAANAWRHMREAAHREGIVLESISGYRSHDYQLGIFERKLARGLTVEQILTVNAAPGYSEHHSGCALDIGTPGEPPAEESFEHTAAFAWLQRNAAAHGFHMSYPRDNPHGIVYEPWHWRYGVAAG